MSNTPFVNTTGRAAVSRRKRSSCGGQIFCSKAGGVLLELTGHRSPVTPQSRYSKTRTTFCTPPVVRAISVASLASRFLTRPSR